MRKTMTIAAVLAASQAAAFCDEGILETDVLCVTEEAEEIKLCRTVHPMTEMEILTLNVDPAISKGPHSEVARDIPFAMTLGTGGYPWDSYGLTFFDEGGHAVLNLRRAIDAVDNSHVGISLDLFGRGAEPQRTLTCMVPALRALGERAQGAPVEISVLTGPEGGFTKGEIELARENGAVPVSLGPRILRAETAGIATVAAIMYEAGEMGRD